jgi:hypothetical protein
MFYDGSFEEHEHGLRVFVEAKIVAIQFSFVLQRFWRAMKHFMTQYERLKSRGEPVSKRLVLIASLLTLLLLFGLFCYLSFPVGPSSHIDGDSDEWASWAEAAWRYFQPGVGVNSVTGLHYATADWQRLTDWDLGVYISAIISAERLGLVSRDGQWGSDYRFDKVLSFLETRPITADRLPYAQYDANTGGVPSDVGDRLAHPSDSANLLLALDDLRSFRPDFSSRIDSIVGRYNFESFAQSDYFAASDIYPFYAAQGYGAFGFSTPKLRALEDLGGGSTVNVYGEEIPEADVTSEPLLLAILGNRTNELYETYANKVFLAQQSRYELTGRLTAFSEGAYLAPQYYVYEWIVTGAGKSWQITAGGVVDVPEVVYTKMAFAFHAVYDDEYTRTLVNQVSSLVTGRGFLEGVMEDGKVVDVLSDKTNGMILQAACYFKFSKSTHVNLLQNVSFPRYAITTFAVAPELIDEQLELLRAVGAYNVTLVCREDNPDKIKSIYDAFGNYAGCIVPELSFMQTLQPSEREQAVDARFTAFKSVSGSYPSGIFSFQLDTYTLNYLRDKFKVDFAVGNICDQVNIDFMSLRGGFAMPYYASRRHSLVPARVRDDASVLVVPPFAVAPTNRYHFDNNHLIDLYNQGVDAEEFKYVSLNYPFFTPFFLELDWLINLNSAEALRLFTESYSWVYENFHVVTAEEFAEIFESSFSVTPQYHFVYTSSSLDDFPETKGWKIEWLMSSDCRIARVGDKVVSALSYKVQSEDPFLASSKKINFMGSRFGEDPNNIVRTDLSFDIDALWQSEYGNRTLKKTGYAVYTGRLEDFY